jgi:hypothetical protein
MKQSKMAGLYRSVFINKQSQRFPGSVQADNVQQTFKFADVLEFKASANWKVCCACNRKM